MAKNKKNKSKPSLTLKYTIAGLAIIGMFFMLYLANLHYSGAQKAVCDLSDKLSCSTVNESIYSEILGIPVSILGLLYFLSILIIVLSKKLKNKFTLIFLFTLFSLVYSLSLSSIEFFEIKTICLFCELSKVVMLIILITSGIALKTNREKIKNNLIISAVIVGLLFSGLVYMIQNRPATNKDYSQIAKCLSKKNVFMYGTYWCPSCAKQRRLFGKDFEFIHEIECDPRGKNAQTQRCIDKNIEKTPTWIMETQTGQEIKRIKGVQKISYLAEYFDCNIK